MIQKPTAGTRMCIGIPSTDGWLGHPGRVGVRAPDDPFDGDELTLPVWPRRIDEDLGLQSICGQIGHQLRVEVVVAHRPGRGVRDAAGDDPRPGAVHPSELVPSVQSSIEVMEAGGDPSHLRELSLEPGIVLEGVLAMDARCCRWTLRAECARPVPA